MSKLTETKRVLSFMRDPKNMPQAETPEVGGEQDLDQLMMDIVDENSDSPKKTKKKKKKLELESDDMFKPGMESTTVTGDY